MNLRRNGLTLIEMLTVVAVIAILIGLLLPATTKVRHYAQDVRQRSQLKAIELGLETFKGDFGEYPASNPSPGRIARYGGAQKLAEAMLGLDLLGYNPASDLQKMTTDGVSAAHLALYTTATLNQRKELYLNADTANAFRVGNSATNPGLYDTLPSQGPAPDSYVLCDTYAQTIVQLRDGTIKKAGSPILYYRANPLKRTIRIQTQDYENCIYNIYDNMNFISVRADNENARHGGTKPVRPFVDTPFEAFYGLDNPETGVTGTFGYIQDPKVTTRAWPYNPDTYMLISAGRDGIYGTSDDIRNFGDQ